MSEAARAPAMTSAVRQGIVSAGAARAPAARWDGPLDAADAPRLPGIGPARAAAYARVGLVRRRQLLYHLPARYRVRRAAAPLAAVAPGEPAAIAGRVVKASVRRRGRRATVSLRVACDGGGEVTALIFNRAYLAKGLLRARVWLAGRLDDGSGRFLVGDYERLPEADADEGDPGSGTPDAGSDADSPGGARSPGPPGASDPRGGGLLPIYRLPPGIAPRVHRKVVAAVLDAAARDAAGIGEWRGLAPGEPDLATALSDLHRPRDLQAARAARERLAFDEAFALSLEMVQRRRRRGADRSSALPIDDPTHAALLARLPHAPTAAQARVIDEVRADLAAPGGRPMARLLQGDVGSGKTQIALYLLLAAARAGRQGALMAPTEILARQHAQTLRETLGAALGASAPQVALVTGGGSAAERRAARRALASGEASIAVGTHGLQSRSVTFADLGVTIVDEQHRFGVRQRVRLALKGPAPHLLVMTATPIPRTLALAAYGELDVSVIDELPPGRRPRTTRLVAPAEQPALWRRLAAAVADGECGYVVCPSIDGGSGDGEPTEGHSVAATLERVRRRLGPAVRVEAVHGRLDGPRQRAVLDAFRAGEVHVLVATVLVEVGLDVPRATFVVVPDPARFGLATLHQVRGRVGRGERPGACYLLGPVKDGPARQRVEALVASEDGFALAEQDLRLRGPGEVLGTRQSGMPAFAVLDPARDGARLAAARAAALAAAAGLSDAALARLRRAAFPEMDLDAADLLAGG